MKTKTIFYCTECGNEFLKWSGKCTACGAWNTIVERPQEDTRRASSARRSTISPSQRVRPITELASTKELRFPTGLGELDRVLGGGAVKGSLVLVGGAPGIGKSTLMLQICSQLCCAGDVLYISGEESEQQLKLRAERMDVCSSNLYVLSETNIGDIMDAVHTLTPNVLIIDSIQTMSSDALDTPPGSIGQVKECTTALMHLAKGEGITVFVIGHVNKEGSIAGPKVLEHMVDCVLYFEGDQHMSYRILRAAKNRFGTTNEIGVFEMAGKGLAEVPNPSELLLSGRPDDASGTCVTCAMEGARPILAEIQALIAPTAYANPRRTCNGLDYSRSAMLMAVLEKRGGLKISNCDVYLNVIGGLTLDEPSADLAVVIALASSYFDVPVPNDLAAIGEVGLTGELRSVQNLSQRLLELQRLGFRTCMVPAQKTEQLSCVDQMELIRVKNIAQALQQIAGKAGKQ